MMALCTRVVQEGCSVFQLLINGIDIWDSVLQAQSRLHSQKKVKDMGFR